MNKADTLRKAFFTAIDDKKLDPIYWGAELSDSNLVSRTKFRTFEILMPSSDLKAGERVKSIEISKDDIEKGEVDPLVKKLKKTLDEDYKEHFKVWSIK